MEKLYTAGLIAIKDNKLLLAFSKNKQAWYLPGGKLDEGETSKEALLREIKEELNVDLNPEKLKYLYHITAQAYGQNPPKMMEQDCFIYDLTEKTKPSNEIEAVHYFDYETYKKEPVQVPGALAAFKKLKELGLI
ncbi:NUDIX hydrolase [Dysgonomonas capnocytophagoides]|uniref:NUDIX hydrolase n=1 Tax=Dysgonomonas capnocytophagoides TaxID=45254 RepID=UPI00291E42A4|nr:NUDIX domain-containing protein [Dysgonomonas capnocytophagoides]